MVQSISTMAEYAKKIPEELRWEDYRAGNRGRKHVPAPPTAAGAAKELGTCCICLDATRVYAFVPCGHLSVSGMCQHIWGQRFCHNMSKMPRAGNKLSENLSLSSF